MQIVTSAMYAVEALPEQLTLLCRTPLESLRHIDKMMAAARRAEHFRLLLQWPLLNKASRLLALPSSRQPA